jgi:hypothetical protein
MLPIVNTWISQPIVPDATGRAPQPRPIPADLIQKLAEWLNNNGPPAGTKLLPESTVQPQAPQPPAAQPPTPPQPPAS